MTPRVSVLLCTKNRISEVHRFLRSLTFQTQRPDETLVLDGASQSEVAKIARSFTSSLPKLLYETVEGDLTVARNQGVRHSTGDILFFLDDDLELDPHFIENIVQVFRLDTNHRIGGVCGTLQGYQASQGWRYAMNRLLMMPTDGNGKLRFSGAATWVYSRQTPQDVHFLPGGLTAYRREVFNFELFDEALPLFGFTDDVDFSCRVSRRFRLHYEPSARAHHFRPANTRTMSLRILGLWVWAYWRTYQKNRPYGWWGYPALALLTIGFAFKFLESRLLSGWGKLTG